jgi:hypothetical protein
MKYIRLYADPIGELSWLHYHWGLPSFNVIAVFSYESLPCQEEKFFIYLRT